MSEEPFTGGQASLVPAYHWLGARPWLLDLDAYQTGWAICLVLCREGDCQLLPVAWQRDTPGLDDDDRLPLFGSRQWPFHAAFHADAVNRAALELALAELRTEGWQVSGRLDVHFNGRQTTPEFWAAIHPYLWQSGVAPGRS